MAKNTANVDSLDAFLANVSEDGTHLCVVDNIASSTSQTSGKSWIVFTYAVTDESNELDGEEFLEFVEDFSHVTIEDYKQMSGADKKKVRDAKGRLKARLTTLGVSEDESIGFVNFESLIGKSVNVTVETSFGNGRKYVNVRNVELV